VQEAATICPRPIVTLTVDLLILKVVSSVPILVLLGLSILDLGPMYATDRQPSDRRQTASSLNAPAKGRGIVIPAETAASRKQAKYAYAVLSGSHMFQPIALETSGPINESAVQFLNHLGHKIISVSAHNKEGRFLFKRLSIALQRFNAILLHESF